MPHVCEDDKEKGPTASKLDVFSLESLFLGGADDSIEESPDGWNKFLVTIISWAFICLFFAFFLDLK